MRVDEAYDILAGTWMNEEYSEVKMTYKFIVQPDGTYIGFPSMSTDDLTNTGRLTILDTMIDSDGTIWIKAQNKGESDVWTFTAYELQKYSNSNMTFEVFDSEVEDWWGEGFPTDLEPVDHVR